MVEINISKMDEVADKINDKGLDLRKNFSDILLYIESMKDFWKGNKCYSFYQVINKEVSNVNNVIGLLVSSIPQIIANCSNYYRKIYSNDVKKVQEYTVDKLDTLKTPKLENTIGIDAKKIEEIKINIIGHMDKILEDVKSIRGLLKELLENYWNDNNRPIYTRYNQCINNILQYFEKLKKWIESYLENATIIESKGMMVD